MMIRLFLRALPIFGVLAVLGLLLVVRDAPTVAVEAQLVTRTSLQAAHITALNGGGELRPLIFNDEPIRDFTCAPDGQHLAFGQGSRLYIYTADGREHYHLTLRGLNASATTMTIANGGRTVLVFADGAYRLLRVDPADPQAYESVRLDIPGNFPALSGDGSRLAYMFGDQYMGFSTRIIDTTTGKLTGEYDGFVRGDWSPSERVIAFEFIYDSFLYLFDTDRDVLLRVRDPSQMHRAPTWLPDGQHLAFAARADSGNIHVHLMDIGGSSVEQVEDPQAIGFFFCFLTDYPASLVAER